MSQHNGFGMFLLKFHYFIHRETLVNMTTTVPKQHITASHAIDITTQVIVRTEDYLLVLGQLIYNLLGIS